MLRAEALQNADKQRLLTYFKSFSGNMYSGQFVRLRRALLTYPTSCASKLDPPDSAQMTDERIKSGANPTHWLAGIFPQRSESFAKHAGC